MINLRHCDRFGLLHADDEEVYFNYMSSFKKLRLHVHYGGAVTSPPPNFSMPSRRASAELQLAGAGNESTAPHSWMVIGTGTSWDRTGTWARDALSNDSRDSGAKGLGAATMLPAGLVDREVARYDVRESTRLP